MTSASPAEKDSLLEVDQLARSFASRKAVDGVSFGLNRGECLAVFGPNGAGKTTLLRMLAGILTPSSGRATLAGIALPGGPAARARVGLISHNTMLYEALSPRENVLFAARLYGLNKPAERTEQALSRMAMLDRADTPLRSLSRGMQQRVSIARATVHAPELVLADEPYNGLDESGARALTALLHSLRDAGTGVLIVTHNIAEGLALANHAAVMNRGKFERLDSRSTIDTESYATTYRQTVAAGA
jgi:heme exporter protein A